MASDNLEDMEGVCSNCGGFHTIRDHEKSEEVCSNCGNVVREGIKDLGPEWRAYSQKEVNEKKRGGPPITEKIHDKGLSTRIDYKNRDSKGRELSPEQSRKMYRVRKQNKRSKVNEQADRNLAFALQEINRMKSQLGLSDNAEDEACSIYKEALDEGLIRGHSIEGVASAALYAACRNVETPKTFDEIEELSKRNDRDIKQCYRNLTRNLDIDVEPVNPENYIPSIWDGLDLSREVLSKSKEIIRKSEEKNITVGKGPRGVAAGSVYLASKLEGERKTQDEVAEASDVCSVTLRNRYQEMDEALDL